MTGRARSQRRDRSAIRWVATAVALLTLSCQSGLDATALIVTVGGGPVPAAETLELDLTDAAGATEAEAYPLAGAAWPVSLGATLPSSLRGQRLEVEVTARDARGAALVSAGTSVR